jgi:hypothetical protein
MSYFKLVKPKRRSGWPKMDKIGTVPLVKIQLSMPGKIRILGDGAGSDEEAKFAARRTMKLGRLSGRQPDVETET